MSKWDKLLKRIYTFRRPDCPPITIPKHEPIKKVYVELVKQAIENIESEGDESENFK